MNRSKALIACFLSAVPSLAVSQTIGPVMRVVDVTWPNEPPITSASAEKTISDLNVPLMPVLLPPTFLTDKLPAFTAEPLSYTAYVWAESEIASITGTRIAADLGDTHSTGEPTMLSSSGESQAEATMVLYGVAYTLTVECNDAANPRCADDAYARGLLESAVLVGGSRGAPPPLPPTPVAEPPMAGASVAGFDFRPAGQLAAGAGTGVKSEIVYAPGIRFPIEKAPAYLNSQVWGIGGYFGPRPTAARPFSANFRYPWQDTFCEKRDYKTPACPSGFGHQGVDIRAGDGRKSVYWAVAAEAGRIHKIGTYSVVLVGDSGTQYTYLHLNREKLVVERGQRVMRGHRIGLVSDEFGRDKFGKRKPTTVHLHFEIRQNLNGRGLTVVSPFMSLVRAYQAM